MHIFHPLITNFMEYLLQQCLVREWAVVYQA